MPSARSGEGSEEPVVNTAPEHPHDDPPSKPVFAVRYQHAGEPAERCIRFGGEANARAFFARLALSMHPAEVRPVAWVELSVRVGVGPREILDFAPEGGAR